MILTDDSKRLGVFIFYDKDGFVDDYVQFLLNSLKEATNDIIIISNTNLAKKELKKLKKYSNKIRIRENIGLDAGAFKYAYDEFSNYFKEFDELLLLNDTFYGPFIPFKKICKDMNRKDYDFWGLTANYDSIDSFGNLPDGMIHTHIQTFFIAFRKSVLESNAFNNYWNKYDVSSKKDFINVVTKHEISFTHYLEKNNFKWGTYVDLNKYHSENLKENFNIYAYAAYDLIKNYNCPFLKRKNLVFDKSDALYLCDGNDSSRILDYLSSNKLYNTDMILKNISRLYNPIDIYYGLNMNYSITECTKQKKYAILLFLEEDKYINLYVDFLKNTDIKNTYIFTNNKKILKYLKKENLDMLCNKSFDKNEFDYIGIIYDENYNNIEMPISYINNLNNIIVNGLYNNNYVNGIGDIFEKNPYLGLLILPSSFNNKYIADLSKNYISYNQNGYFVKKELFDDIIFDSKNHIDDYLELINNKNLLFAKIYNQKELMNTISTQDYLNVKLLNAVKKHGVNTLSLSQMLFHLKTTTCYISKRRRIKIFVYRILKKIRIIK